MSEDKALESEQNKRIIQTFREKAIHTAILIDDRFPSFKDLCESAAAKSEITQRYGDMEKANLLYQTCRSHNISCDVENDIEAIGSSQFERVRRSDLVILDYHLTSDLTDATQSLAILSKLASNKHFNLVVVYTRSTDLKNVWTEIAATLRKGVKSPSILFSGKDALRGQWEQIVDDGKVPLLSEEMFESYLTNGKKQFNEDLFKELRSELEALEIAKGDVALSMEAVINYELKKRFNRLIVDEGDQKSLQGRMSEESGFWLLCGSVFIVVTNKKKEPDSGDDPEGILKALDQALISWKPNILQLLVSEIQNQLQMEALAYDPSLFRDPGLQVGWIYSALATSSKEEGLDLGVEELYRRIFETVRDSLGNLSNIKTFHRQILIGHRASPPKTDDEKNNLLKKARELANVDSKLPLHEVMYCLNAFLSTQPFQSDHVTTGTLFFIEEKPGTITWWICASPACDMVPRPVKDSRSSAHSLFPYKAMTALLLTDINLNSALEVAEEGRHIFLRYKGEKKCFVVGDHTTKSLRPYFFLLQNQGKVSTVKEFLTFSVSSLKMMESEPKFISQQCTVVGQLREPYASWLLQHAGFHLSRIGVDYEKYKDDDQTDGGMEGT